MSHIAVWRLLSEAMHAGVAVSLLLVVDHQGSSPGRRGFKMAVTEDGRMAGSVGGGIMEHKFVEMMLERMREGVSVNELRRQIHAKEAGADRSGMICSGEQVLWLKTLEKQDMQVVDALASGLGNEFDLVVGGGRMAVEERGAEQHEQGFFLLEGADWSYRERLGSVQTVLVVGGGHVGNALCKLMKQLDWYVVNVDDRPGLNTFEENAWADEKWVLDYADLGAWERVESHWAVVLVTFGYRTDEICLRQLAGRRFPYIGMMGSKAKVEDLWHKLESDGVDEKWLSAVRAPAGLPIQSQTPMEIAVSIAAELIAVSKASSIK